MARKKVNLQYITNKTTRRVVYKKRCKSLMKKARDLVRLCGIKACVVVYGEGETQPDVWPSVLKSKQILKKFKAMPDLSRYREMQDQKDFLINRISMLQDQVCKLKRVNQEYETLELLHKSLEGQCPGFVNNTIEEVNNLSYVVDTKMMQIKERLQQIAVGALPKPQASLTQASYTRREIQMTVGKDEVEALEQEQSTNLSVNGP